MSSSLPTTHATSKVLSTKAWLLLLGLLTVLLVVAHRVQPPMAGGLSAGRPIIAAHSATPATQSEAPTRRVALETSAHQANATATL